MVGLFSDFSDHLICLGPTDQALVRKVETDLSELSDWQSITREEY
jgi:hypothetical protein